MRVIAAVSGGVDSMLMLDELVRLNQQVIVAHVNHGLRATVSDEDEMFVREAAQKYGCLFESHRLVLNGVSEAEAREARWRALQEIAQFHDAVIATAHHQDDIIETVIINIIRGTGWRGLASLRATRHIVRPLLDLSKAEIMARAIERGLSWREDASNDDPRYLRNAIRLSVVPRITLEQRQKLLALWRRQNEIRVEIEQFSWPQKLLRHDIIMNEPAVAREIMRVWLASHGMMVGEKHRLELLVYHAKAAQIGTRMPLPAGHFLVATRRELMIE